MREYECMLILPAEADEAMVGTAVERIAKVIAPDGGEGRRKLDRWGRKRFAYEIARPDTRGTTSWCGSPRSPRSRPELDRALKLADEVIRHKVLLLPDEGNRESEGNRFPRLCGGVARPNEGGPLMASDNQITIVGNLTDDPELRYTANGAAVANFRVAYSTRIRDAAGNWTDGDTSFFTVNCWRAWRRTPPRRSRAARASW